MMASGIYRWTLIDYIIVMTGLELSKWCLWTRARERCESERCDEETRAAAQLNETPLLVKRVHTGSI